MGLRAAVNGAGGRMGKRLVSLIVAEPDLELVCASERPDHPDLGGDVGELAGMGHLGLSLTDGIGGDPQVVMDFSTPEGAARAASAAGDSEAGLVCGTTGLGPSELAAVEEVSGRVPVVFAPNFSLGVNLLFRLAADAAEALGPGYDCEILELHHNRKADSPSGTALRLAESVAGVLGRDVSKDLRHGRQGRVGPRPPSEIGMHSIRAGDAVGEHTVIFAGGGERIELIHRAHTRDAFALGAVRAAKFLVGKPAGMYSMAQVLGLG